MDVLPTYPGAYTGTDNLLSVASSTKRDTLSSFSNYGSKTVHMGAPGSEIFSTTHDGGYGYMSGTSMATPIVAGAAALVQSLALRAGKQMKPGELRALLMDTGDRLSALKGKSISGRRLNVTRAVQTAAALFPPAPPPPNPPPPPSPPLSPPPNLPSPPPPSPPSGGTGYVVVQPPTCGTSPLRGQRSWQSSTAGVRSANKAVDGDCRTLPLDAANSCASTGEPLVLPPLSAWSLQLLFTPKLAAHFALP
jgi:hypothetical protein